MTQQPAKTVTLNPVLTGLSHYLAASDAITTAVLYFHDLPSALLSFNIMDHAVNFDGKPGDAAILAGYILLCAGALVSHWYSFQKTISYLMLEQLYRRKNPQAQALGTAKKTRRELMIAIVGGLGSMGKVIASSVSVHNLFYTYSKSEVASDVVAFMLAIGAFVAIFSVIGVNQNNRKPKFEVVEEQDLESAPLLNGMN